MPAKPARGRGDEPPELGPSGDNRGEARNALARAVFFNRLGQIRDRTHENQHHRARGLNLLIAAIVLWNSRYLEHAVTQLRARGRAVDDRLLAHVWPLGWERINLTGDYSWGNDQRPEPRPCVTSASTRHRFCRSQPDQAA